MISVIIPTDESERAIVPTLACLVPGATEGLLREVILADAGSEDDTAEIGDIAGCRVIPYPGTFGVRLAYAASVARGDWLMFLRPGVVLEPGWFEEVRRFIGEARADRADYVATFRPIPRRHGSALQEMWALLRLSLSRRLDPERGLVISKRHYQALGGHLADAKDPETHFLWRIPQRRMVLLRVSASRIDT
jgi:glycosyltransferase involved in cell wall biosynthesis